MLDRTIAPPFTRSTFFELISPVQITLRNGLNVYTISGGNQSVIKIEILIKGGRWTEKHFGAAYFSGSLLSKGTSKKSSFEIAQIFDQYGAHLEINPGMDMVSIVLYTLNKNLQPTLSLLYELLTDAAFPEKELAQTKSIYQQNLKVNNEKTSFLASKLIRANLFGKNHPYGKELEEGDVNAITRDMLHQHVQAQFGDFLIIASGQVTDREQKLIQETFSNIPIKASTASVHANDALKPYRQIQEKEGSLQSSLRSAKEIISRTHPDYPSVLFLTHVLGGYFGSRLMKNIREEKGLTYGIYASYNTLKHKQYLVIGADVNKENLELTFDEIKKELARLYSEPVPLDELDTARNHFIGSLQSEMTTPFAHADKLKSTLLYNLPEGFYQTLINRIDQLTDEDLMETASKYFQGDSFFEVAVG
ncbi:M16 family metallopeptidase [Pseudochryseolinea flava]|uniref:Insulinase family protein n=1 Tax=Pseudochryseolinea flava TaxID=2059302 RepID=A0A364Y8G3_9BACT|nr:pitrilysin family protein [Pseudochryseolinea flava]RAW03404.1 insulinase family protein [Pseudochryseolinea flava]